MVNQPSNINATALNMAMELLPMLTCTDFE